MEKEKVVATFFEEVWTHENTTAIKELFVPDTRDKHAAEGLSRGKRLSPDDFQVFQQSLLQLLKNIYIDIDHAMEKGDWIAFRCTMNAKSRSTGEPVTMVGSGWCRITDGKIREAYNFFDFLNLFESLKLLPGDTMQMCLNGRPARWREKV